MRQFLLLSAGRQSGWGPPSVPPSEVLAFCLLTDVPESERGRFFEDMAAIDDIYLDEVGKLQNQKKK